MIFTPPYQIVIIDDDQDTRQLLKHWIQDAYRDQVILHFYTNFSDALKLFKEKGAKIHMAIVDLHIGKEHGEDFIAKLTHMDRGMKIMATSADMGLTPAIECFNNGASYFLDKPLSRKDVVENIKRCIEHFKYWHKLVESRVSKEEG